MTRWVALVAATTALVGIAATAADAAYVKKYRIRDLGERIVHRISWCVDRTDVRAGRTTFVKFHTRVRRGSDGGDQHLGKGGGWYARGCTLTRLFLTDNLRSEGWYYGRVRITIEGHTLSTGWWDFRHSSS
jgi:hypothetical protein